MRRRDFGVIGHNGCLSISLAASFRPKGITRGCTRTKRSAGLPVRYTRGRSPSAFDRLRDTPRRAEASHPACGAFSSWIFLTHNFYSDDVPAKMQSNGWIQSDSSDGQTNTKCWRTGKIHRYCLFDLHVHVHIVHEPVTKSMTR